MNVKIVNRTAYPIPAPFPLPAVTIPAKGARTFSLANLAGLLANKNFQHDAGRIYDVITTPTSGLPDVTLTADVAGRALFAADFFNAATVLAKFATDSFDNPELLKLIKDGAFLAADVATLALFGDAIWPPAKTAVVAANGVATPFQIYKALAASGVAGTADDVSLFAANAPFAFRILDIALYVSTNVGGASVTLRDTAGGAGAALSEALSVATTGVKRPTTGLTTSTVAANGTLTVRRSDRSMVGELILTCIKT